MSPDLLFYLVVGGIILLVSGVTFTVFRVIEHFNGSAASREIMDARNHLL